MNDVCQSLQRELYGKMMLASLSKLRKIEDDLTVYPGHGEPTSLSYEKENNMYMKLKHVID